MLKKNKKIIVLSLATLAILSILLLSIRYFTGETARPGHVQPQIAARHPDAVLTAEAIVKTVTEWYGAVGTVIPRTQAHIESQVAAQVTQVLVQAGEMISKGQLLIRLEDDRLKAARAQARQSLQSAISRREQARQAVRSAEAALAEAESEYERVRTFETAGAATRQSLEQAQSRFLQAQAGLRRAEEGLSGASAEVEMAREMVEEAEISWGYSEIVSPADGRVLQRLVDPGDMAMPGKPLLRLSTVAGLQIEARVRESLVNKVRPDDIRQVQLVALDKTVDAVIVEIMPFIEPLTRTFLVKADLPEIEGAVPGMYGKLMIPYAEASVVLIPPDAVHRVGQLELVTLETPDGRRRRYIKTGNIYDDRIEVLSGLNGGETLLLKGPGDNGR